MRDYCRVSPESWYRIPKDFSGFDCFLVFFPSCVLFVFLERSHAVLSMIFGIFGKFGIEIGTRKKIGRKKNRRKKNPKTFGRKFFGTKNFRFLIEKIFDEKVNENSKF